MKPPQQYTSAEIKMIDSALKKDWKRKKKIAMIIVLSLSIVTLVLILTHPLDSKNLHDAWPMLLPIIAWLGIYDSYKYLELIKKLAISNVDNDKQKP